MAMVAEAISTGETEAKFGRKLERRYGNSGLSTGFSQLARNSLHGWGRSESLSLRVKSLRLIDER